MIGRGRSFSVRRMGQAHVHGDSSHGSGGDGESAVVAVDSRSAARRSIGSSIRVRGGDPIKGASPGQPGSSHGNLQVSRPSSNESLGVFCLLSELEGDSSGQGCVVLELHGDGTDAVLVAGVGHGLLFLFGVVVAGDLCHGFLLDLRKERVIVAAAVAAAVVVHRAVIFFFV
jgi:hypothetical protein